MVTREPKSSSYRTLKIPAFLFDELETKKKYNTELLKKAKSRGVKKLPYEYISISTFGIRKTSSSLTPALKKISSEAGIPAVRMHMLRHCFATLMIESGVPLEPDISLYGTCKCIDYIQYLLRCLRRHETGERVIRIYMPGCT